MRTVRTKLTRVHPQAGFTFLEIIIALMILATASGILIGLESATIRRTIQDRSTQQAMLAARRIMAAVETTEPGKLASFDSQPLLAALEQLGVPPTQNENEQQVLEPFTASLQIEAFPLPVPNVDPDSLLIATLRVSWGENVLDGFELQYLIPVDQQASGI